jgi:hypothetical protein
MHNLTIKKHVIEAQLFIEQKDFDDAVQKLMLTPHHVISVTHGPSSTIIYYWAPKQD